MRMVTSVSSPGSSQGCAGEDDLRSATNVGKRSGYGIEKGRPSSGTKRPGGRETTHTAFSQAQGGISLRSGTRFNVGRRQVIRVDNGTVDGWRVGYQWYTGYLLSHTPRLSHAMLHTLRPLRSTGRGGLTLSSEPLRRNLGGVNVNQTPTGRSLPTSRGIIKRCYTRVVREVRALQQRVAKKSVRTANSTDPYIYGIRTGASGYQRDYRTRA